ERRGEGRVPAVPRNVGLPWLLNSKTDLNVSAGPFAAFLGQAYDPVWTDFDGKGTRVGPINADGQTAILDPFAGTTPQGRFQFTSGGSVEDLSIERVHLRRSLLGQFDAARRQ